MDFATHQQALLTFYVQLIQQDGWKEYAWNRVKQMARDCPELYSHFPAAIKAAMNPAPESPAALSAATPPPRPK